MKNTITPVTFRRLQFSQFFRVTRASNFCPLKATLETEPRIFTCRNLPRAMPRKRTPDDTGGVVASGTSILHRFAPSHAIVRAFYEPLTQYSTVPSN